MTVRQDGVTPLATLSNDGFPPLSGRFWALSADSSNDEDAVVSPESSRSDASLRYVCRTPPCDHRRDLRTKKGKIVERRKLRRWAAQELALTPSPLRSSPVCFRSPIPQIKLPVLTPMVFSLAEAFREAKWTLVQRKKRRTHPVRRRRSPPQGHRHRSLSDRLNFLIIVLDLSWLKSQCRTLLALIP